MASTVILSIICLAIDISSAQLRKLGKGHHGGDNFVPVRQNSTYITDAAAYSHGLPPMQPFPEETALLYSEEVPLYGYNDEVLDFDMPKGYGPMEAHLPYMVQPEMPAAPSKQMAPPVKGPPLPPIMIAPPSKAPPVAPMVVTKNVAPPPEAEHEKKKGKKSHGHGGHGGHGKKKKGKHGATPIQPPIVIVLPEKHVMPDIPPPPIKGHEGMHHGPHVHESPDHYHIPPYSPMDHERDMFHGHQNDYHHELGGAGPLVPAHDWVTVGNASPGPYVHAAPMKQSYVHETGYRPVSKARDPWN